MTTILGLGLMQQRGEVDQAGLDLAGSLARVGMHTLVINFGPSRPVNFHPLRPVVPFGYALSHRFHDLEGMIAPTTIENLDYAELGMSPAEAELRMPAGSEPNLAGHLLTLDYDFVVMIGQWRPNSRLLSAKLICSDLVIPIVGRAEESLLEFFPKDLPLERVSVALTLGNTDEKSHGEIPRGIKVVNAYKLSDAGCMQLICAALASLPRL